MKRIFYAFALFLAVQAGQAQVIINEVLYDPSNVALDGDANGDGVYNQGQDEFIEFVNTGAFDFDMSGYQIWDDTLTGLLRYTIPSGTLVPPGGALVVFGGGVPVGSFGGAVVLSANASANGLSLNNSAEIIILKNNLGQFVASFNSDALSDNPNESYTRNPDITGIFVQHSSSAAAFFSPGTKVDGTPFNTTFISPPPALSYTPMLINEVLYDPSNSGLNGDANGDGSYEQEEDSFIEFINTDSVCYDMSGYQIWDDTTSGQLRYTIPSGTLVPPGGAVVVFGGGMPTGTFGNAIVLVADTGVVGLSLTNSGEVIVIRNAMGEPVLSFDSDALSNNPDESYTRNPDLTGAFEQHNDNFPIRFSPGTKVDGTPFNSVSCAPACTYLDPQVVLQSKYSYTASWTVDPAATEYSFEYKKASDPNYSVKTTTNTSVNVNFPGPGTYDIRVGGLVNGVLVYSCVESFEVDCFPVNAGIIVFKAPFCATSPATYRVNFSGGVGAKTFLWSNGSTNRSITVAPGTYSCTVSDVYGCDTTVSISSGAPAGSFESTTLVSVVKAGASFTVNWNAKSIPGAVVLGYRAAYRVQGSGAPFFNSPLVGGTSHVFNLSSQCNANYEFTVFVRYQYTGMPAATSAPACSISRGHNNGPIACKGESSAEAIDAAGSLSVYPNPTHNAVFVALNGEETLVEVLDINGRVIMSQTFSGVEAQLELGTLAKGTYVLRATTATEVRNQRILKN